MNETFLEAMARKGWVKAPDGSWHKPRVERPIMSVCHYTPKVNPSKRIRQNPKPLMNKLETAWYKILQIDHPKARPQAVQFRLGNGIQYRPDFIEFGACEVTAWEVKGPHAFRGGLENLKVAAGLYPEIRWILVWKEDGEWMEQDVLP